MVDHPIEGLHPPISGDGPHRRRTTAAVGRLRWSRLKRWPSAVDAALVAAAVIALVLAAQFGHAGTRLVPGADFVDITVYHGDIGAWLLHGKDLYTATSIYNLQFTYPPFAALVLAWTAVLSVHAAGAVMAASGLLAEGGMLLAAWRVARPQWTWNAVTTAALLCLAVTPLFDPVAKTLATGQVNLGLMALVMLDRLVVPRRYRGLLTGVAAAVKLTPAVFVLYALVRGRWREAALGAVGGVACTVVGLAVLPADSVRYWTDYLFDTDRVGGGTRIDNQSIAPVVARAFKAVTPTATTTSTLVYGVAVVVALALGFLAARAADRRGARITEAAAVGIAALLVSPVSWTHHWVWVVPLALGLLVEGRTRVAVLAALLIGWVFCNELLTGYAGVSSPASGVPIRTELHYALWVAVALVLLAYLAVRRPPSPATGTAAPAARTAVGGSSLDERVAVR